MNKLFSGEWYHGDLVDTDFNTRKMDVEDYTRDRNAVGPGIYFTRDKSQAEGYAFPSGYVYTATLKLDPSRVMTVKTQAVREKLKRFVDACPDKESLYNYDQNLTVAVRKAVDMNIEYSSNFLDAVLGVYNDLYQRNSRLYAKNLVDIGFDAYLHHLPEVDHLVVWNPAIIHVLLKEKLEKVAEARRILSFDKFTF